jgi:hypothetical protein
VNQRLRKILFWIVIGLAGAVIILCAALLAWRGGLPIRLVEHYSLAELTDTALLMDECADCHEGQDYHRCSTCHDEHGAVEFADLPFYNLISFTGDVPQPGYVRVNQVLPYQDHPNTHIRLTDFLEGQGVMDFESITLTSWDGGFVTIPKEDLTDQALLLPYSDGIRFAAEDLHESTWLKGISGMIVVGKERDLSLNGEMTSIGRLLLGPIRQVTVQTARVMFASESDGQVREAQTASRLWGASLAELVGVGNPTAVKVTTRDGGQQDLSSQEIANAILISDEDGPVLVLPDRSRSGWITGVSGLSWEER